MTATVPDWLGNVLPQARPGHARLAVARLGSEDVLNRGSFSLRSAAFADEDDLDPCFTADEEDAVAPPLEWSAPPEAAVEIALIVEDPDAPGAEPFCHWLVWGLAAQRGQLLEGEMPPRVGKNAFGNSEWLPPAPPVGDEPHDYVFQLFALDKSLGLMPGASRGDLIEAMEGHVLAATVLTGTYARSGDDDLDWEDDDGI